MIYGMSVTPKQRQGRGEFGEARGSHAVRECMGRNRPFARLLRPLLVYCLFVLWAQELEREQVLVAEAVSRS